MGLHDRKSHRASSTSRSPRSQPASAAGASAGAVVAVADVEFPQRGAPGTSELQASLDEMWAKNLASHSNELFAAVQEPIKNLVSKVSKETVSLVADKVSKLEGKVDGVDAKVDKLATSVEQMQKQLHEMALQGSKPMSQGTSGSFPKASEPTPTVFNTTVFFGSRILQFCSATRNIMSKLLVPTSMLLSFNLHSKLGSILSLSILWETFWMTNLRSISKARIMTTSNQRLSSFILPSCFAKGCGKNRPSLMTSQRKFVSLSTLTKMVHKFEGRFSLNFFRIWSKTVWPGENLGQEAHGHFVC